MCFLLNKYCLRGSVIFSFTFFCFLLFVCLEGVMGGRGGRGGGGLVLVYGSRLRSKMTLDLSV